MNTINAKYKECMLIWNCFFFYNYLVTNINFGKDISSTIIELESTKPKSATPTKILSRLEDKVLEELNQNSGEADFDIDNFKDIWSRRIALLRKEHNLNDFVCINYHFYKYACIHFHSLAFCCYDGWEL